MDQYDVWNSVKKDLQLDKTKENKFPKVGEVWMNSLGVNIGFEQNGSGGDFSRPVLVVKKFNNHMFWVVPLSTKQKKLNFYYNFTDPEGLQVSAILAQMKLCSIKRFNRKMYYLDKTIVQDIKSKVIGLIKG